VKIAEQLERWPDDIQTRMLVGDALFLLGDAEAALVHSKAALPLAQQDKDYRVTRELSEKIFRLTHSASAHPVVQRRQPRSNPSRSQRKGKR
jgi:thioredoxin-like negative regulator of GroEL